MFAMSNSASEKFSWMQRKISAGYSVAATSKPLQEA
jgi:hypothetical protein